MLHSGPADVLLVDSSIILIGHLHVKNSIIASYYYSTLLSKDLFNDPVQVL